MAELKLNADIAPAVSSRLGITGIPTFLLMQRGREISRASGAMDTRNLVAWTMAGLARSRRLSNPTKGVCREYR